MEDKCSVNCDDFPGDFRTIHGMKSALICSEYKEGLFEVMADSFMYRESMLFT